MTEGSNVLRALWSTHNPLLGGLPGAVHFGTMTVGLANGETLQVIT